MGPLEIFLESNKVYKNIDNLINQYKIKPDNLKDENHDGILYQIFEKIGHTLFYKKLCNCKKGSLVIWSSKIIHRGGANYKKRRPVFYFSLQGNGAKPYGATYSLLENKQILISNL